MMYHTKDKDTQAIKSASMVFTGREFFGVDLKWDDMEIMAKIGEGSYGRVYKAKYLPRNKRVALKEVILSDVPDERDEILEDFAKEVTILQILVHERIIHFLGAISEPAKDKFAMLFELGAGSVGSLLHTAENKKVKLTWRLLFQVALDAVEACGYLHSLDPCVIHRDLKAENLLLNEKFRCLLSDFGLSRSFERKLKAEQAMTICGTPCWVAPEIFRGEPYTEKVDVYSFGVVLWELFALTKPYKGEDAMNLPFAVAKGGLRPPELTHCPPSINKLMKSCWADAGQHRPSMAQMQEVLEGEVNNELRERGAFDEETPTVMDLDKAWA